MRTCKLGIVSVVVLALGLGGCSATTGMGNGQLAGTAIGAGIGGLAGSMFGGGVGKLVGVGLGTVLGGLAGNVIGKSFDDNDKLEADNAALKALNTARLNQPVAWENLQSGNRGEITATREGYQGGQLCREYQMTVTVGGKRQQAYGNACRQQDGSWKVVS